VARFSGAMANLTNGIKAAAVAQLDAGDAATLVDVGGADGSLLAAVLRRHPDLHGVLFDLPHVVAGADKVLADAGVADRVEVVAGSFFDAVPAGDAYLLSFVLHDWSDAEAIAILQAIRAANPEASLLILELVTPPGDQPHLAKMIDLTMLGMLSGHERDEDEWRALLAGAGFELEGVEPTPGPMSVLRARAR
jgi:O-methyltransferase domain